MKHRVGVFLLAIATGFASAQVVGVPTSVQGHDEGVRSQVAAASPKLPLAVQSSISAVLGRDNQAYSIAFRDDGLQANNPLHKISAEFKPEGLRIRNENAKWSMALLGYGYGDALRAVGETVPRANGNRVEYNRGPMTEWYVNGSLGLEQGFTLSAPPGRRFGRPLTIALAVAGDFKATLDPGNSSVTLRDSSQKERMRYVGLTAYDAAGTQLRTWLEIHGGQLRLEVADAKAVYPIVVDPWLQLAQLISSDGKANDFFGNAIAVSADNNTVAIGAFQAGVGKNIEQGAVYVFVKPKSGWTNMHETAKLTASDGQAGDSFGNSVAISAGAKTLVIGAYHAKGGRGAVYVYGRPAKGWTSTSKFTARLNAQGGNFGSSVSTTGTEIVAGADAVKVGSNAFQGAAYVYVQPAKGWKSTGKFTAKLTTADGNASDLFGYAVKINSGTITAGAPQATIGTNWQQGAAYLYVKPAQGWVSTTAFTAKLTSSNGAQQDFFGNAVAISSDGSTVVTGAEGKTIHGEGGAAGAAYLFIKPGGGWVSGTQTAELTASNGSQGDYFGSSLAISTTADTVVVGAYCASAGNGGCGPGAAYVFVKPNSGWANATETQELTATSGKPGDSFGIAVGIGVNDPVVGAFSATVGSNPFQGAAYVF